MLWICGYLICSCIATLIANKVFTTGYGFTDSERNVRMWFSFIFGPLILLAYLWGGLVLMGIAIVSNL